MQGQHPASADFPEDASALTDGRVGLSFNIFWGIHPSTVPYCTGVLAPWGMTPRSLDGRWSVSSWRFWPSTTYYIFRSWRPIARSRDFANLRRMLLNRHPWGRFPACFLASFWAVRRVSWSLASRFASSKRVLVRNKVMLTYSLSRRLGPAH